MKTFLSQVSDFALKAGATECSIISVRQIDIRKSLSEKCREPRCENYGLSKSCPPFGGGVERFEKIKKDFSNALFFRIEIPKNILFSSENMEIFRFLHETSSKIEHFALEIGISKALALAGGSCKKVFCGEFSECLFISEKKCRFPKHARESMSGFGIDVGKMAERAGWSINGSKEEYADIFGLVLLR